MTAKVRVELRLSKRLKDALLRESSRKDLSLNEYIYQLLLARHARRLRPRLQEEWTNEHLQF
jgi:predicted HicB family RNase H-like nuclease